MTGGFTVPLRVCLYEHTNVSKGVRGKKGHFIQPSVIQGGRSETLK